MIFVHYKKGVAEKNWEKHVHFFIIIIALNFVE